MSEVRLVTVKGQPARITAHHAGVADWVITLELPSDGQGNIELTPHAVDAHANH